MLRFIMLFLWAFSLSVSIPAQETTDIVDMLGIQPQVDSLEQRINKMIRRNPQLKQIKGLRQYHIFNLVEKRPYTVEHLFDDVENIRELACIYGVEKTRFHRIFHFKFPFKKEKRYLEASTMICDSLGNILATTDWFNSNKIYIVDSCLRHTTYRYEMDMVHYFMTHKLNGAFRLSAKRGDGLCWMEISKIYGFDKKHFYLLDTKFAQGLELKIIDKNNKKEYIERIRKLLIINN